MNHSYPSQTQENSSWYRCWLPKRKSFRIYLLITSSTTYIILPFSLFVLLLRCQQQTSIIKCKILEALFGILRQKLMKYNTASLWGATAGSCLTVRASINRMKLQISITSATSNVWNRCLTLCQFSDELTSTHSFNACHCYRQFGVLRCVAISSTHPKQKVLTNKRRITELTARLM